MLLSSRDELIATLFRETDRAQRMKTPLTLILCGIDQWEVWRSKFDPVVLENVAVEVVRRTARLLRCYDTVERCGEGEFAVVLPGCNSFHSVSMAERLEAEVFGFPVAAGEERVRFGACFGVAGSGGRSPLVVLRNAEEALKAARARGAGAVERCAYDAEPDPAMFLMPVIEDEALHW